jgi:hypothetical protein
MKRAMKVLVPLLILAEAILVWAGDTSVPRSGAECTFVSNQAPIKD